MNVKNVSPAVRFQGVKIKEVSTSEEGKSYVRLSLNDEGTPDLTEFKNNPNLSSRMIPGTNDIKLESEFDPAEKTKTVYALRLLELLENAVRLNTIDFKPAEITKLKYLNMVLKKKLDQAIREDVVSAMAGNMDELNLLFDSYITWAMEFDEHRGKTSPRTIENLERIEKYLPEATKRDIPGFRLSIVLRAGLAAIKGVEYKYDSKHGSDNLKSAVLKCLEEDIRKEKIAYSQLLENATTEEEQKKLIFENPIIKTLVESNKDYNYVSALKVIHRFAEFEMEGIHHCQDQNGITQYPDLPISVFGRAKGFLNHLLKRVVRGL